MMKKVSYLYVLMLTLFTTALYAQATPTAEECNKNGIISFSVEAEQSAMNDFAIAELYIEQTDSSPAKLAKAVNQVVANALDITKQYHDINVQTSGTTTTPVYTKSDKKIETWRMRSSIRLETAKIDVLSELIQRLQTSMMLSSVSMTVSPATRKSVVDNVTVEAIRNFEKRAQLLSSTLEKRYRIKKLDINESGFFPYRVQLESSSQNKLFSSAPMPLEAGNSTIRVNINGSIELTD